MTIDFGFYAPATPAPKVSIGSTVFVDSNNNGIQDATETGIAGLTVTLYEADGTTVVATTTTDANGDYYFGGLDEGSYVVGVMPDASYPVSSTANSGDDQVDGNNNGTQSAPGAEAKSTVIALEAGTEPTNAQETAQGGDQDDAEDANGDMTIDFGFHAAAPAPPPPSSSAVAGAASCDCDTAPIQSNGADTLGVLSILFMMFMTLLTVQFFIRQEETKKGGGKE